MINQGYNMDYSQKSLESRSELDIYLSPQENPFELSYQSHETLELSSENSNSEDYLNDHLNLSSNQFLHQGEDLLKVLKSTSKFLCFEINSRESLEELISQDDNLIGIAGDAKKEYFRENTINQFVPIRQGCQINNVKAIRPYAFSNIFLINNEDSVSAQMLVNVPQTFTIKLESVEEIQQLVKEIEEEISSRFGEKKVKLDLFLQKLRIYISIIQNSYWLTFNKICENDGQYQKYLLEVLGLQSVEGIKPDLLQQVKNNLTLELLLRLIKRKNELNLQKIYEQIFDQGESPAKGKEEEKVRRKLKIRKSKTSEYPFELFLEEQESKNHELWEDIYEFY